MLGAKRVKKCCVVLAKGLSVWYKSINADYLLPGEIVARKGSAVVVLNKNTNKVNHSQAFLSFITRHFSSERASVDQFTDSKGGWWRGWSARHDTATVRRHYINVMAQLSYPQISNCYHNKLFSFMSACWFQKIQQLSKCIGPVFVSFSYSEVHNGAILLNIKRRFNNDLIYVSVCMNGGKTLCFAECCITDQC